MPIDKPSDKEDEFFLKMEAERLKKYRSELDKKRDEIKSGQKHDHWMKCPKCGIDLEEVKYQEVMIDRCNKCQGIWLDAGELDLLVKCEAPAGFLGKLFGK